MGLGAVCVVRVLRMLADFGLVRAKGHLFALSLAL